MGGSESVLRRVELGEPLISSSPLYRAWTDVCPGLYRESQSSKKRSRVSVFVRTFAETDSDETKKFFENGIQSLKQLRHPNILAYLDSSFLLHECCLITERVKPLELCLEDLNYVEILSGLKSLCEALTFLHEKAHKCHNNVSPTAVFVTLDGQWKLGGLECSQELEKSRHWVLSDFAKTVKDVGFCPPEDQQVLKSDAPAHARDCYGFGKLMEFLLPYLETLFDDSIKREYFDVMNELISEDPVRRPQITNVNDSFAFRNGVSEVLEFVRKLPMKSADEKRLFFSELPPKLCALPSVVVAKRLCKPLLSRYVLLEPTALQHLLPALLKPREEEVETAVSEFDGVLPLALYERWIIPELCKVYCVHERSVRLSLLRHFKLYVGAFCKDDLETIVLPELLLGMKDANEEIVSASMRSLADLVPILGAPTVTGLTHRKYFAEGKPRNGKLLESVIQASDLKNVKTALERDASVNDRYADLERKRQRELKLAERRVQFEQKKEQRRLRLQQKTTETTTRNSNDNALRVVDGVLLSGLNPENESATGLETSEMQHVDLSEPEEISDGSEPEWTDWDATETANAAQEPESHINVAALKKVSAKTKLFPVSKSVQSKSPTGGSVQQKSLVNTTSLGSEFEIKAIKRQPSNDSPTATEVDFFADMAPKLSLLSVSQEETTGEAGTKKSQKPRNLFEVALMDDAGPVSEMESNWLDDGLKWDED